LYKFIYLRSTGVFGLEVFYVQITKQERRILNERKSQKNVKKNFLSI